MAKFVMRTTAGGRLLCAGWCIVLLTGCGEPLRKVNGRVQLASGEPVASGQVEFQHTQRQVSAVGFLDDQGHFTLGTNDTGDGAYDGTYAVAIKPPPIPVMIPGQDEKARADVAAREAWLAQVPPRYHSVETSGITLKIDSNSSDDVLILIEP